MLVEASILAGASATACTTSPGGLALAFDGAGFTRKELEALGEAMFITLGEEPVERRRRRALQLFAVAMQAALGLGLTHFLIRSKRAGGQLRVEVDEGGERWDFVGLDDTPRTETTIELRFGGGRGGLGGLRVAPGVKPLGSRCAWTRHPLRLDGVRINQGLEQAFEDARGCDYISVPVSAIRDDAGVEIGVASVLRHTRRAGGTLHVMVNGWLVERIELPAAMTGFEAIVEGDLPRDLSFARIIQGSPAYEAMLEAVMRSEARLRHEAYDAEIVMPVPIAERAADGVYSALVMGFIALVMLGVGGFLVMIALVFESLLMGLLLVGSTGVGMVLLMRAALRKLRARHEAIPMLERPALGPASQSPRP